MSVKKSKDIRCIALISDLHIGSRYAVCPDKFQTVEGQWLIPSSGQVSINDSFRRFGVECDRLGVDTVLINGDLLHGQNVMESGLGVSSCNMDEQISMGVEVLRPLIGAARGRAKRRLFGISGSGYHKSGRGINPEQSVINVLGGDWLGSVANLLFTPSKRMFNIHHGQSAAFIYREMLAGREILFSKWAEGSGRLPHIDVIVRGHLHTFMHLHENGVHYIQLPCWMAFEPSKITLKLYAKMTPDIGGVIVRLDERDRIIPYHFLYEVPHVADKVRGA